MDDPIFLILIYNAALLITMAYIYSLLPAYENQRTPFWIKVFMGGVVSAIGLSIMLTSWPLEEGLLFDTRSVLLGASGLYLGAVPTLIAAIVTSIFRIINGGAGMVPGIGIILISSAMGLIWRHYRRDHLIDMRWRELYLFGLAVHVALIPLLALFRDPEIVRHLIRTLGGSYIILYPLATMLLGRMLAYRLQRERDAKKKLQDMEEQRILQLQLKEAQKMEAVGRLAGGVAHDYNNKMQVVLGFTEIALRRAGNDPDLRQYLEEIQAAANKSARLTNQLMTFARKQPIHPCVCNLNDLIEDMMPILRKLIGEDIEIAWHPAENLWPVMIDPLQVDEIMVSLAGRARDAMKDTGQMSIETQNRTLSADTVKPHPDAKPGDYVMISVTDTGENIPPEAIEHLFEPFYSISADATPEDLGLAVVYGVVRQNNGFVHVDSITGQGTSFKIYFPHSDNGAVSAPLQAESSEIPHGAGQNILVIDDDKFVLDVLKVSLTKSGYRVLAANSPTEALTLVADPAQRVDLMITDVIMPEMNGHTLYERIADSRPGLKVIYISGYTEQSVVQRGVLGGEGSNFFQKPFSIKALTARVHECLQGQSDA